jgi:hypothetical protein
MTPGWQCRAGNEASQSQLSPIRERFADPAESLEIVHIHRQRRYFHNRNGGVRRREGAGHPPLPLAEAHPLGVQP